MKHSIMVLLIALCGGGCSDIGSPISEVKPTPNPGLTIQTNHQVYTATNPFAVDLTFGNRLGRNVQIVLSGCGFPQYILQKRIADEWQEVGAPLCIGIALPPRNLFNAEEVTASVTIRREYINAPTIPGTYRLQFLIVEINTYQSLPQELLLSNAFEIDDP
jgi:hypothetical protein